MEDMTHVHSALMYKCRRHTRYYNHVYLHPGLHLVWGLSYIRCMYNSMTGQWISLERDKTFVQHYINDFWRLLLWNSKVLNQKKTYFRLKKAKYVPIQTKFILFILCQTAWSLPFCSMHLTRSTGRIRFL